MTDQPAHPRWAERWLFGVAALLLSLVGGVVGELPGDRARLDAARAAPAAEAAGPDRALAGVERVRAPKALPDRADGPEPVAVALSNLPAGLAMSARPAAIPADVPTRPIRTSPRIPTGPPLRA